MNVQYGQFDLGVGYRTAANLSNAATEFAMEPLVFDAIVGMRIYALQQEINISTNIGTDRSLENSNTTLHHWSVGDCAGMCLLLWLVAVWFKQSNLLAD